MPIRADCSFFLREYRRILTNVIEKHYLLRLMLATGGDMTKTCALAGTADLCPKSSDDPPWRNN